VISRDVVFRDRYGLHPRSAHRIQEALAGTTARVTFENLSAGGSPVDARSMLSLISAGIRAGDMVLVTGDGADEQAALAGVGELLEAGVCHP